MRQLVLKIVRYTTPYHTYLMSKQSHVSHLRGSYPSVAIKYSRDLRSLVDSCLKHHPRERPSINAILRLPFIQQRIENFLSETVRLVRYMYCTFVEYCSCTVFCGLGGDWGGREGGGGQNARGFPSPVRMYVLCILTMTMAISWFGCRSKLRSSVTLSCTVGGEWVESKLGGPMQASSLLSLLQEGHSPLTPNHSMLLRGSNHPLQRNSTHPVFKKTRSELLY